MTNIIIPKITIKSTKF